MGLQTHIKIFRQKNHLTVNEMAKLLGLSESYLYQLELGNVVPPSTSEAAITKTLNSIEDKYNHLNKLLNDFYIKMLNEPTISHETTSLLQQSQDEISTVNSHYLINKYKLFHSNFLRKQNKLTESEQVLTALETELSLFNDELFYYYYRIKGGIYYYRQQYQKSLDTLYLAEKYLVDIDYLEAEISYNIAVSCTQLYQLETAHKYLDKAITIYERLDNTKKVCWCFLLKSTCYSRQKNLIKSEEFLLKTLEIASQHRLFKFIGGTLHNLAVLESNRNNLEKANKYYKKSLLVAERLKDLDHISHTSFVIAKYYKNKGDSRNALKYIDRGLRWCQQASQDKITVKIFEKELLAMKYYFLKQWEEYEKISVELMDKFAGNTSYYKAAYYANELSRYFKERSQVDKGNHYLQLANQYESQLGNTKNG